MLYVNKILVTKPLLEGSAGMGLGNYLALEGCPTPATPIGNSEGLRGKDKPMPRHRRSALVSKESPLGAKPAHAFVIGLASDNTAQEGFGKFHYGGSLRQGVARGRDAD